MNLLYVLPETPSDKQGELRPSPSNLRNSPFSFYGESANAMVTRGEYFLQELLTSEILKSCYASIDDEM